MSVTPSPIGGFAAQFFDNNGVILSGGKIYTYAAGTTTPQATYTSAAGVTPHANPIILDSAGRVPGGEIWLTDGLVYKFVIETATSILIGTYDNITGVNSNFVNYTVQEEVITATAGQTVFNLSTINYTPGTNSLTVYIDGVNQYVGDSYLETDSNTVTFTSGVHVGGEVKFTTAIQTTTGAVDASIVAYDPPFTGSVATNVEAKLAQYVSVEDFGAVGDGVTDDTASIQAALDSGVSEVVFPAGRIFIVDGGLDVTTNGQQITAYGATIKLKANAATKWIINSTATDVVFAGGTYDGNKANGNSSGSTYDSFCVGLYGDRCTCQDIRSINMYGIGVKGFGNYLSALNCRISNTEHYGIFFDGSASVSHTGNRALGNTIDMSEGQVTGGQNIGQGILFSSGVGQAQIAWELADNNVIGPQTTVADQAINLAVRGNSGIVSNNTTRYGAMGFSEGGANTVVTGNRFLNLVGSVRIGIEPSGKFTAIGNIVTDAYVGIDCTATASFDESLVSGNQIAISSGGANAIGIRFQIVAGQSGKNINITGNSIDTSSYGVYVVRDCEGLTLTGNTLVGPGIGSGRGVFFDTVQSAVLTSITGNTFNGFLRPWSVYSAAATTFTDLYAANNHCINCGGSQTTWPVEGSAVIGAQACVLGATYGKRDTIDVQGDVFTLYSTSYSNPEGFLTAGFGSIFVSLNSGGGVYRKNTGTGNTGWVAM